MNVSTGMPATMKASRRGTTSVICSPGPVSPRVGQHGRQLSPPTVLPYCAENEPSGHVGIDDAVAAQRTCMNSYGSTTRVGVIRHPGIAGDMLFQHEDVAASGRDHAGCRRRPRETEPVRCQIQFRHDTAKHTDRRTAAAERPRATGRTTADSLAWRGARLHGGATRTHCEGTAFETLCLELTNLRR